MPILTSPAEAVSACLVRALRGTGLLAALPNARSSMHRGENVPATAAPDPGQQLREDLNGGRVVEQPRIAVKGRV